MSDYAMLIATVRRDREIDRDLEKQRDPYALLGKWRAYGSMLLDALEAAEREIAELKAKGTP